MHTSSVEPMWLHDLPPATAHSPPSPHVPQPMEHSAPHGPGSVVVVVVGGGHTAQQNCCVPLDTHAEPDGQSASEEQSGGPHPRASTHTSFGPTWVPH